MTTEPAVLYAEDGSLGFITLNRPEKLNTLNAELLQAFEEAVDRANASDQVRAIVLRGAGRSFSAGYDLNPTGQRVAPASNRPARRWDPVRDYQGMSRNVRRFMKLWEVPKPVVAQVHGWCVGGGTDLALCSDLIFMADDAHIGYPPSRVYGTPTSMMWVYRLGLEAAKRYILTGDAIDAKTALRIGLVSEIAPAEELPGVVERFARRFENIPSNQLALNKLLINQAYENMGLRTTQMFGTFFDGMTRNTQEAIDWRDSFSTLGFRETIRRRDAPFEDYGERRRE
jgi:enoyl-CoA hydratase